MLWIRSQNQTELIKLRELHIAQHDNCHMITDYPKGYGGTNLGKYKTKKRALEVLDEIAMYLVNSNIIVYDMPEK